MSSGPTRRNVIAGAAAAVAATAVSDSAAQVAQTGAGLGAPTPPAPTYVGPGDVSTNAAAWYGVKAYSAAKASTTNKMITLSDITNASASIDLFCTANGSMDLSPLTGITSHTFQVVTWYDQTGNGNHATQPTQNSRPLFTSSNGLNGAPGVGSTSIVAGQGTGGGSLISTTSVTYGSPFTSFAVTLISCSTNVTLGTYLGDSAGQIRMGSRFSSTNLQYELQNNAGLGASASTGWHAAGMVSGSTNIIDVDGGTNRSSFVYTGATFSSNIILLNDSVGAAFPAMVSEIGIWNRDIQASFVTLSSNARSSYRYGSF